MNRKNPICVALDTPDVARARALVQDLRDSIGFVKVGLEFFYAHGAAGYRAAAEEGVPVFLDLKLHDIPNTVEQALRSLMALTPAPAIVNVHATGGEAMLRAARRAVPPSTKLIAVTILTSLDDQSVHDAGFDPTSTAGGLALRLATLTERCGLDGVVCSPLDLPAIRTSLPRSFLTVVPGIRPEGADKQDQKRVATPSAAITAGADILVIGRAITGAPDPIAAANTIRASLP